MVYESIKNIGKKFFISLVALATLSIGTGCATFKSVNPYSIKDVNPITDYKTKEKIGKKLSSILSYEKLTWQEAIEYIQTPKEAEIYMIWLRYRDDNRKRFGSNLYLHSFKRIYEGAKIDCFEGALAVAALLSDNGYPPLVLIFGSYIKSHAVFLYKQNDRFGSIGINMSDMNKPMYESLDDLVKYLAKCYKLSHYYQVINLSENDPDWLTTNKNMIKLPISSRKCK